MRLRGINYNHGKKEFSSQETSCDNRTTFNNHLQSPTRDAFVSSMLPEFFVGRKNRSEFQVAHRARVTNRKFIFRILTKEALREQDEENREGYRSLKTPKSVRI